MKKHTLTAMLVAATIFANAQVKPKGEKLAAAAQKDTAVYQIRGDTDLNILYQLLTAGLEGVSQSDAFSKNQAKVYQKGYLHIDSLFRPQINKYHPQPKPTAEPIKKTGTN